MMELKVEGCERTVNEQRKKVRRKIKRMRRCVEKVVKVGAGRKESEGSKERVAAMD